MDEFDPIAEVDRVIDARGRCWFGKYGQILNPRIKDAIALNERANLLMLVRKGREEEGSDYIYKIYRLLDVTQEQPTQPYSYPRYYNAFIRRIGSWCHIEPYTGPTITIDDLVTRSSQMPLRRSLASSMRGNFNAIQRAPK